MNKLLRVLTIAWLLVLLIPIFYLLVTAIINFESGFASDVFFNPKYHILFWNSVLIGIMSTAGSVVVGFTGALLLGRYRLPLSRTMEYLCLLPLLIPSYFITIAWIYLGGNNGLLTNALKDIFQVNTLPFTIYGVPGVVFILILTHFPVVMLLTLTGLRGLDFEKEKAAWLVTSRLRAFFRISLPHLMPYLVGSAVLVFVLTINNFDVPAILLVDVYPSEVFYQLSVFYKPERAMMLSLPLVAIGLIGVIVWWLLFRNRSLTTIGTHWKPSQQIDPGLFGKLICLVILIVIFGLAVFVPLLGLISQLEGFNNIPRALAITSEQIINSMTSAGLATLVAIIFGLFLGYLAERSGFRPKGLLWILILLPLVIPGSAIGIGLIKFYNQPWLLPIYKSVWIIVIGLITRFMFIPSIGFASALKMLDRTLEDSARVAGLPAGKIWQKIILPLVNRPLLACACIFFILALNELSVAILVNPPGFSTVSVRIYSLYHFNQHQIVSALCLIMSGLVIILYSILSLLTYKHSKSN